MTTDTRCSDCPARWPSPETTDPAPRSRVEGLLEEGRRLLAAVEGMTPAPWHVRQGDEWTCDLATSETFGEWNVVSANKRRDECDANMAGIAALRNDAPALIRSLCEALGEAVADALRVARERNDTMKELRYAEGAYDQERRACKTYREQALALTLERDHLREALREIALAGMSPPTQFHEAETKAWHARRAWEFIGIAARALDARGRHAE